MREFWGETVYERGIKRDRKRVNTSGKENK